MAIDTKQKRMSALNLMCPWRGCLVDAPESGTTLGNRQAAAYLYSGIAAAGAPSFVSAWALGSNVLINARVRL